MSEPAIHPLLANPEAFRLGEVSEALPLDRADEHNAAAELLAEQARRSLFILSDDLDPRVFDTQRFEKAVSDLAKGSRYAEVKILVRDVEPMVKHGRRLIETSRRLSSFIQIRRVHPDDARNRDNFLLADLRGVLQRTRPEIYEGTLWLNNPALARELQREFMTLWEHGIVDPNIRRLHI